MLSIFRRGVTSKIMLVVLGIGLLAIVVTGFGTDGMGGMGGLGGSGAGETLVSVEDERITTAEITDQVQRQLERAREQQPELDMASFLGGGAFNEILRQLVSQKALLAFAEEIGITASKRMVDGEIASVPASGTWPASSTRRRSRAALQREGVTEAQLRRISRAA
jgi:peptidyl-prolyl cis-trans isomerase D